MIATLLPLFAEAGAGTGGPPVWQVVEHIVALSSLVGLLLAWLTFRRKQEVRRIEPQPLEVRESHTYALDKDCAGRKADLQKQIDDLWKQRKDDDIAASIHRRTIYDRIGEVEKTLQGDIKTMPSQIITILRNTGAIRPGRGS